MNMPGVEWTPGEAASVNEFLSSKVGRKWLAILMTRKPRLDMTSTERAAITGAFAAGYEQLYNEIAMTRVVIQTDTGSAKVIDMTKD